MLKIITTQLQTVLPKQHRLQNHISVNPVNFNQLLKFLQISLNNDFVSFAFYILFGLFSVYCLIKLLEEFFEVKDPKI